MDHIPRPHNRPHQVEIPIQQSEICYGEEPLGFSGFQDFPRSIGYDPQGTLPRDVLQSWLFFGLLTEIFGGIHAQYRHVEFIKVDASGRRMACTKMVDKYAFYWVAMRWHEDRETVVQHAESVDSCLKLANSVMNTMASSLNIATGRDAWSSEENALILSIMTLCEYLCSIRENIVKFEEAGGFGLKRIVFEWRMPLIKKALEQHWCPGEILMLEQRCNLTCLYYLSTLGRAYTEKEHRKCSEKNGCQALQINLSTYRTAHLNDCTCGKRVGPIPESVADTIVKGDIPLVVGPSSTFRLLTSGLDRSSMSDYVAISHVWSDGLGNNDGNWLNECMFNRIQNLVNRLYDRSRWPVPFWMDTLCVPKSPKFNAMKQLAIAQMADIYRTADKVLILDKSLQMVKSADMAWTEMSIRIAYSPWATRVWTLQEARLAKEAFVQFKDKAISLTELQCSHELSNNFELLSQLFHNDDKRQLLENISSRRLVRAVATYQCPPSVTESFLNTSFANTDEEQLHEEAVRVMRQIAPLEKLKNIWRPWLEEEESDIEEREEDGHVRSQIGAFMPGPVARDGSVAISRICGWGYAALAHARKDGRDIDRGPVCELFLDVCSGFRGRTTSRMEDETVCLGLLLQMDIRAILAIQPIPWRRKEFLAKLDSKRWVRYSLQHLGLNLQKQIRMCHEERTKLFYRGMVKVPIPIIFWNAPRLESQGWKWAPQSILHKDLQIRMFQHRVHSKRGIVTDRGLTVRLPGFRLRQLSRSQLSAIAENTTHPDGTSSSNTTLVIHTQEKDHRHPWRRSWQRLRFRESNCCNRNTNSLSWVDLVSSGAINNLAILIQEEGVLVKRIENKDECEFASHIAVIERVSSDPGREGNAPEVYCFGEYFETELWCIG